MGTGNNSDDISQEFLQIYVVDFKGHAQYVLPIQGVNSHGLKPLQVFKP